VYTGKAIYALEKELQINPERFKGNKILFIHTGGIYGFIDGSMEKDIKEINPIRNFSDVL
jgi:D-cysteine desulfhydrase